MPINQITLAQLTNEALAIYDTLNQLLTYRVLTWAADVNAIGLSALQAAPYNLSLSDAQALINAANDLDNFRKVWTGAMYVAAGATLNTGVPTNNDGTHFGYPFNLNPSKVAGLGY